MIPPFADTTFCSVLNLFSFCPLSLKNFPSSFLSMATAFPCSCSSSTANLLMAFRRSPPPVSSISNYRFLLKFTGLNIQLSKAFRRPDGIVCEASETSLDVPTVADGTWKSQVLGAECPVLVEFWAPWCGPCRMLHPVVGEVPRQYTGRLKCFNLNTDHNPSIVSKSGVQSIPTIMIFVNGEKKDAVVGAVPKITLTASIEKFL